MKNNRREFCKMMAAGMVGAVLPVGTVNAKTKPLLRGSVKDKIEVQPYTRDEIARLFQLPPHKLRSIDRATFNNIKGGFPVSTEMERAIIDELDSSHRLLRSIPFPELRDNSQ